jgi:carbonic anhydrase
MPRRAVPGALARIGRYAAWLLLAVTVPVLGQSVAVPPWSYAGATGPEHWADLSPDYAACRDGTAQSPIDIQDVQPGDCEPLQFMYRTQTLEAINDGRGVQVVIPPGSLLMIGGETYELMGFHFHSPGENLIRGKAAAAEIHLVHRSAAGRFAVVVVPIQPSPHANATLGRIVDRLPLRSGEQVYYRQVGVNPLFILPQDKGYYAYTGSLANPPCSEPVAWFILAQPVGLEVGQLRRITETAGGDNVRSAHPQNGRPVYACR